MQGFLLATAARRCMQGKERPAVSDSMFAVLQRGEMVREFMEYLVHNNDVDVRHGWNCAWHSHLVTKECEKEGPGEAWQ